MDFRVLRQAGYALWEPGSSSGFWKESEDKEEVLEAGESADTQTEYVQACRNKKNVLVFSKYSETPYLLEI